MNRQKKKVNHSSDQDDQVSIFDSEEEEHKEKSSLPKTKDKNKKGATSKLNKNKPKRVTAKSREKKLSKDEDDIMRRLTGKKEQERSRQSTESQKKELEDIKFDEGDAKVKKQCTNIKKQEDQKEESNPYEEIPFLDEYSITKDNPSQHYGTYHQQYPLNSSIISTTSNTYNKLSSPYFQINPQQQYSQQTYYNHQHFPLRQTYNSQLQFIPNYGYQSSYNQIPSQNTFKDYPVSIDPNLELNFQDFQQVNFDDDKLNEINMQELEQLQEQVAIQKKIETQNENKRDKKFRKRRMAYILSQIQKLKKQYIELQNLNADSFQAHGQQNTEICNLLKQWKYDPNLLKKPEKPKIEVAQIKTGEQSPQKSKTEYRITMLNEVLTQNPFLTQVQMADVLRVMDPVMNARIERSVVLRLLKICGFKKKKIRGICKERNTTYSIGLRCEYARKYREYVSQNFQIFYFDELILNEYFDKESGWCKAEEEMEFRPQRFIDRSVVVMAILSSKGICKWNARFGNYQLQQYCKTFNHLLKTSQADFEKRLLIVNPLPYRDPMYIVNILQKRGWEILVLPSDGLGLNPLQSYFTDVRDIMKRKRYDTVETLFQSVVEVLQDGDKQGLANKMLSRVEIYVDKAIRRQLL